MSDRFASRVPVSRLTRRGVLRSAAGLVAIGGATQMLAACGDSGGGGGGPAGTLRLGLLGAGQGETFNPKGTVNALINIALCGAVYDSLVRVGPDLSLQPWLATKWEMSESGDAWTFQLREGVKWHDGSPFTADDVVSTIKWTAENGGGLASYVSSIDIEKLQSDGGQQLKLPMLEVNTGLTEDFSVLPILQEGTDSFDEPVGTGPFVFESFTPGQRAEFTRNEGAWHEGGVPSERLEIISITDDAARLNALMGGQIDAMVQVPLAQAGTIESRGFALITSPSTSAHAFTMAVDRAPFDDVRVRQAMRLIVDRQEMVDVALNGYGEVGNDLYGMGLPYFAESLPPREQDIAAAKALLADAGYGDGLSITLETSAVVPGVTEAATLFQRQAADAGVDVEISKVDPAAYFDPTQKYLKMDFAQTFWAGSTGLDGFYELALVPDGPGNETHWDDPTTTELIATASTSTDSDEVEQAFAEIQQQQYDEGGYIWWGTVNNVDAAATSVKGFEESMYYPLGLPWSLSQAYVES